MPITKRTKLVQMKRDGQWEWVFCFNPQRGIITTKDYRKGQRADCGGLEYFSNKRGNDEFRAAKPCDSSVTENSVTDG